MGDMMLDNNIHRDVGGHVMSGFLKQEERHIPCESQVDGPEAEDMGWTKAETKAWLREAALLWFTAVTDIPGINWRHPVHASKIV